MIIRKLFLTCCMFLVGILLQAQPLHDKHWIAGAACYVNLRFDPDSIHKEFYLNQVPMSPKALIYYHPHCHSSICDSAGNFQFSCLGQDIANKDRDFMEGGRRLVPDSIYDRYDGVVPLTQGSIILPLSGKKYMVMIPTVSDEHFYRWNGAWYNADSNNYDLMLYYIVDMEANGGLGKVGNRQVLLEHGNMSMIGMTACRHANGRDWWLLKDERSGVNFYTWLVKADGSIEDYGVQRFPRVETVEWDNSGQSMFNTNGTQFVSVVGFRKTVNVFDFDRCTGKLSNQQVIWFPPITYQDAKDSTQDDERRGTGVCFSPNSRFLYITTPFNIMQYDLKDKSWYHVSGVDTPLTVAFQMYWSIFPAPNGKLYIGNWGGFSQQWSRIDNPNGKGAACGFCRKCERFAMTWGGVCSPPNLPNYRLGALPGSACDTLQPPPPPPPPPTEQVYLPNAFSPNGDGLNDTWHILNVPELQALGVEVQVVAVYNRWGNEVYKSNNINFSWDGKNNSNDTYFYYIRYRTASGDVKVLKGSINLIR